MANVTKPPILDGTGQTIKQKLSEILAALQSSGGSYIPTSQKGAANGVAELDVNGKVPSAQLPSYVDDVLEYASLSNFPATGESGKIYIAVDTNKSYRWSGSTYVEISSSLALGETSSTAYRGDRGKTAYDHATESGKISAAVASGLYKIAATAQGHIAGLTAVEKADITALGIPGSMPTVNNSTITIKKNGTTVDSFTLNQSSGKNIDISVPTKTSDLTNDSGFVTDGQGAKTVKASIVTLNDAAAIYTEDIKADIEPIQSGSGTPSPSNIRPIQGHEEEEIAVKGVNLFNKNASGNVSGSYLNGQGSSAENANWNYSDFIRVSGTITLKDFADTGFNNPAVQWYDMDKNFIGGTIYQNQNPKTIELPSNAYYIRFSYKTVSVDTAMVVVGQTAPTTYEPYQGRDYVLPLSNKNLIPMQFDNTHILAYNTSGSWNDHTYTSDGVDITVYTLTKYSDIVTGIRIQGTATDNFSFMLCSYGDDFVFTEALKMNASGTSNADIDIIAMDKNNTSKAEIRTTLSSADVSVTDNKFAKLVVIVNSGFSGDVMIYPQIRKARYSSDFAPHNPRLPEVVYGGTLDVTSGELVVDRAAKDFSNLTFTRETSRGSFFWTELTDRAKNTPLILSAYKYNGTRPSGNYTEIAAYQESNTNNYIDIYNPNYSNVNDFMTAMAGQTLCYELATPITYQLTPQEVKLLLNLNNITASTGQVQVKYQPNNAIGEAIGYIQDYIERHAPKTYYPKII